MNTIGEIKSAPRVWKTETAKRCLIPFGPSNMVILRSVLLHNRRLFTANLARQVENSRSTRVRHTYSGGNPEANRKSTSHRCHPILVACVWELTKETVNLPLGCLQGGETFVADFLAALDVADRELERPVGDGVRHLAGRLQHHLAGLPDLHRRQGSCLHLGLFDDGVGRR